MNLFNCSVQVFISGGRTINDHGTIGLYAMINMFPIDSKCCVRVPQTISHLMTNATACAQAAPLTTSGCVPCTLCFRLVPQKTHNSS